MDHELFGQTIAKTNIWINELQSELKLSEKDTYTALKATLHMLRDHMTIHEATDFAAQLPLLLKGVYYDKYSPKEKPERIDEETFVSRIHSYFGNNPLIDPKSVTQKVLNFLNIKLSEGQMEHVKSNMPKDIQVFWNN